MEPSVEAKPRRDTPRRRWVFLFSTLFVFLVILIAFRSVLLPFLFAIIIAYLLEPFVARLSTLTVGGRPLPRWIAVCIVYLFLIGFLLSLWYLFVPKLATATSTLIRNIPRATARIKKDFIPKVEVLLNERIRPLIQNIGGVETTAAGRKAETADDLNDERESEGVRLSLVPTEDGGFELEGGDAELLVEQVRDGAYRIRVVDGRIFRESQGMVDLNKAIANGIREFFEQGQVHIFSTLKLGQKLLVGAVEAVFAFFLTLMIAFFIMIDTSRILTFFESIIPERRRKDYRDLLHRVNRGLHGVVRGQILICFINGCLSTVGFLILDLPYWPVLTVIVTILSLIPIFGAILSSIPAVLIGLNVSLLTGVFTLMWIIGIHIVEAYMLNPKILGTTARIHPAIVVFALLAGAQAGGTVGALLGVPVASILQNFYLFLCGKIAPAEKAPDSGPAAGPPPPGGEET